MLPRIHWGFLLLSVATFGWPVVAEAQQSPWYDYSVGYTPYDTGYAPAMDYSNGSCAPCSSCDSGCATGRCASGYCATGNCGVSTTNVAPNGTIAPVLDPGVPSRTIQQRLEVIEKKLNNPATAPSPARTYEGGADFRRRGKVFPENWKGNSTDFENPGTSIESRKVPIEQKDPGVPEKVVVPSKKSALVPVIDENPTTSLQLDHRVTSRAVAPRVRQ